MNRLGEALKWWQLGYTPLPVTPDGSKRPAVKTWKAHQQTRPDADTVVKWFTEADHDGIGLICGAASGGMEMLELEGRAVDEGILDRIAERMADHDATGLWEQVTAGYVDKTPSGGLHWHYRVDGPCRGNTKLARRPATADELAANPHDKIKVLIETRGQGGFTVVAPSSGRTHPTGRSWERINGDPTTIPTLTVEEYGLLHAVLSTLDQMPPRNDPATATTPAAPNAGLRPGDDFNNRATWDQILTPHGWTLAWSRGRLLRGWTRPGKNTKDGISATTGRNDGDNLYVFSTSTEFEPETAYSKFGAYALLNHGGDHSAAAQALAAEGYGSPITLEESLDDWLASLITNQDATEDDAADNQDTPEDNAHQGNPKDDAADRWTRKLAARELIKLRARAIARDLYAAETAPPAEPFDLDTLRGVMARPADPPNRIEKLLPWSAAMLLIAQRKAGKTTFELNLARSLLTGEDFLGSFPLIPVAGSVALLNYEVSARQIGAWATDHNIPPDRLILVNLRGRRNPLTDTGETKRLAAELRARQVETVIVDPFGRAYTGTSQNDAGEVGQWLARLDQFVRADIGALDLILAAHAGWNGERTRGSSALEDWADVLVNITRDNDDESDIVDRYFRAEGRDVDLPEDRLIFDAKTRTLTVSNTGGRRTGKAARKKEELAELVLQIVTAEPGMSANEVAAKVNLHRPAGVRRQEVLVSINYLIERNAIHRKVVGRGKKMPLHPGPDPLAGVW